MGLFDHFPYTNFHELNLDWILRALKEIEYTLDQFVAINALKYANPIQWNITSQYEKNTIVIDPQTGTAYISVQPVPVGVSLSNTDYWTVVFNLQGFIVRAAANFANTYEDETTTTATVSTPANGWIVWGDTLYKANTNITAGDSYVIGGNISHFTMEDVIGHIQNLSTIDKSNLVAAINEVAANLAIETERRQINETNLQNAINDEIAARGQADNTLQANITAEATARQSADTAETTARQNADNALSNRINTLESEISALGTGDILIMFDSYGTTYGNPSGDNTTIAGIMRTVTSRTIRDISASGSGFVRDTGNGTFYSNLVTYISSLSAADKSKISDVVVAAGRNDWTATKADLKAAMQTFYDYCKNNLPNVKKMMFGYIANGDDNSLHGTKSQQFTNYCNFYSICNELGILWMANVDCVLHNYTYLNSDGVHPSVYGKQMLGYALIQSIEKEFSCSYDIESVPYTAVSGITIGLASDNIVGQMINNVASIRMPSYINVNIGTPIANAVGVMNLFTIDGGFIKYPYGYVDLPCTVCYLKDNILMPLGGKVYIDHDGIVKWNYYVPSGNRADNITDIIIIGNGDVSINGAEG